MTKNSDANKELAAWYSQCWSHFNDRRWDDLSRCYADPVASAPLGLPHTSIGRVQVLEQGARAYAAAFENGTGEPQLTLVNGRRIAAIVLLRGTHTAAFAGPAGPIPPTGRNVGLLALHGAELDDRNQIAREWWVLDMPLLMAQLGLNPAPARPVMEQGWPAKPVVVAQDDMTEHHNLEATRRAYALFNKKDPAMFELFADDVVEKNQSDAHDIVGRSTLEKTNQGFWTGFSDIHVDIDKLWAAGDYTLMVAHLRGTNDGEMPSMGLSRSGKKLNLNFAEVALWENGKIKVAYPFVNSLHMAMQLGLMAP